MPASGPRELMVGRLREPMVCDGAGEPMVGARPHEPKVGARPREPMDSVRAREPMVAGELRDGGEPMPEHFDELGFDPSKPASEDVLFIRWALDNDPTHCPLCGVGRSKRSNVSRHLKLIHRVKLDLLQGRKFFELAPQRRL